MKLFHWLHCYWGRWSDKEAIKYLNIYEGKEYTSTEYWQHRTCSVCNKREERRVY